MRKELPKQYDPTQVESQIYQMWLDSDCFKAEPDPDKKPYSIVMPPPNVTGQLHMGHAVDNTMQDILIRTKRMQGYAALWVPGTDHASIATEAKVVEAMRAEGLTKEMVGRDGFLERAWDWKNTYGNRIVSQLKKLGCSCDWQRERFTMDEGCSDAVKEVFVRLYNEGLIYRGNRMVNWCPHCNTSISDAEVEYKDMPGSFWHIRYPIEDSDEEFIIATTRPETMLGDSGVAVHPDDERYKHLVGKNAILPLVGRKLPIVADEYVELGFGTGAVKMTPCHDPNDYEVGLRHNLEQILCIDEDAKIINGGKYNGMDRYEARKAIVADLEEQGYLVKVEPYNHNVGCCYRCGTVVEPLTSPQWFVKMKPLAEAAIEVVKDGRIKFVPERFTKTYMNWMENVHDWCISRQLWWGHRIPAWYCDDCGKITVSRTDPCECEHCHSKNIHQEEDVLDTWFSSALWPFSTMGWPDKTPELEYFYPTSTLVTGYDIIFFWVARMIVFGTKVMGKIPFDTVYVHGIVRDELGRKMSKSLGNGIDPLEIIKGYGADSLRFSLVTGNSAGNDMRFSNKKVEAARNFCNKVYNASRFVQMNIGDEKIGDIDMAKLDIADKWILHRLNAVAGEVTSNMDNFELNVAAQKVYDFIWTEFCDWYIEMAKPRLYGDDESAKANVKAILVRVLGDSMKLLHPFMPFITEELYQSLPNAEETIMRASWPKYTNDFQFAEEAEEMEGVMDVIRSIRNLRAEMNVPPARRTAVYMVTPAENAPAFEMARAYLMKLAGAENVIVQQDKNGIPKGAVNAVCAMGEAFIPLDQLIDIDKEIERVNKEINRMKGEVARAEGKLGNPGFVAKAPEKVINEEKNKLDVAKDMLAKLEHRLAELQK